jgi:hypothetical protein
MPPEGMRAWTWIYGFQIAPAMLLAGWDCGWAGSVRRRALVSLVNGPVDWTVNAALLALTQIALDTPEATEEIRELFRDRIRAAPKQGAVCYVPVLACCSLQLPESRHGGHRY